MMDIKCGGLTFVADFDSSNIDRVELVSVPENGKSAEDDANIVPNYEFNIWTRVDCAGTEFANNNRSWFYFGVKGGPTSAAVKLNILNLNRQCKLYNQGMSPVCKISPDRNKWERIRDTPSFAYKESLFSLSFGYQPLENLCATTYFAFTYPYSFTDLQNTIKRIEMRLQKLNINNNPSEALPDDIYYHRECIVKSLEGRPIDLITISSHHGITNTREPRLAGLFPEKDTSRPYQFKDKKVIFMSARVHPGETPSSFVMNGVLKLLLNKTDAIAHALRKLYVFKLIPMLNPDGVSRGYYRTDTRGVNLNRYYLNPSRTLHPSVFAARALILYYHIGLEVTDNLNNDMLDKSCNITDTVLISSTVRDNEDGRPTLFGTKCEECDANQLNIKISELRTSDESNHETVPTVLSHTFDPLLNLCDSNQSLNQKSEKCYQDSGLFMYIDFHAHASKKGIFMYGNYFENVSDKVECMLLPKLMSINNQHFHYGSCNFSKQNMYARDRRDGMSKEGCGRVAVSKTTGLIRSYTLECNYNTGRIVNMIPPTAKPIGKRLVQPLLVPPKYTPHIYEEVGQALCISVLDMANNNPNSRLEASPYRNLHGVKEALRMEVISEKNITKKIPNDRYRSKKLKSSKKHYAEKSGNLLIGRKENVPITSALKRKASSPSVFQQHGSCTTFKVIASTSNVTNLPKITSKDVNALIIKKPAKRLKISESKETWKNTVDEISKQQSKKLICGNRVKIEKKSRPTSSVMINKKRKKTKKIIDKSTVSSML